MRIHHLNCGTMLLPTAHLVCHVLLVETAGGLVLVDSGLGLEDAADPRRRFGPARHLVRPVFRAEETAAHQVERLGFARDDVRHIVLTHVDADHIGGLADFPHAQVHLTAAEALGSMVAPSRRERIRYRPAQWAHGPKIVEHSPDGERWRGFAAAKELDAIAPGIVLVSLPGHTRGHACVAVDTGTRWLLHAGDAFYHHGTLDGRTPVPAALRAMETLVAWDRRKVRDNHARLAELYRRADSGSADSGSADSGSADSGLTVFSAHDPVLYEKARAGV
ncbi:MBL fold metallo-hydrolase [Streptomyces sp. JV176]|uniref:MBL fold metallo-hydrolase n=1 Tax=Streptomyces sp. JV176 TaxID=858630 RepID=UPI002E7798D3|nr:MBL fold metallo-hydrolase [Streptomyces sp. JV176]MEE1800678.1 MBL fold metallo-hydrolase [Streptomyces sp. JV176]